MKLQKIIERLQKLHPKKIDLGLNRVQNLCKKLGNPQENLDCISIIGTNGKYSTIQAIFSILKDYNIKTNEPAVNFFLMNFDQTKINSDEAFEKLATDKLILRKMTQYKISNSLRLTIGNREANEHFIKSIGGILK